MADITKGQIAKEAYNSVLDRVVSKNPEACARVDTGNKVSPTPDDVGRLLDANCTNSEIRGAITERFTKALTNRDANCKPHIVAATKDFCSDPQKSALNAGREKLREEVRGLSRLLGIPQKKEHKE